MGKTPKKTVSVQERVKERFESYGYLDFMKSLSPFYSGENAEDLEFKSKALIFLLEQKAPKKALVKEAMHYFGGYDVPLSSMLVLVCAHKEHRYKNTDLVEYFYDKVDSCREPSKRLEHRLEFITPVKKFAKELFLKAKDNQKSFVFGVDVLDFLEKRIILPNTLEEQAIESTTRIVQKETPIRKLVPKKEKPKNSYQNGFDKFGPKIRKRTIVRSINFRRPPKRTLQKTMPS